MSWIYATALSSWKTKRFELAMPASISEERPVCRRVCALRERIAQVCQKALHFLFLMAGTLDTSQNLSDISTFASIMEERNILIQSQSG